ncbi:MAG TPA: GNAT family N-acetyltransferase [Candidatus Ozemobacteraceae bacterium]|nr:GNAT family N-acetyltransferase [Candidatus Ozemobacteraceae bacterium]
MHLEFITQKERWQQIFTQLPEFSGKIYYSYACHAATAANGDDQPAALFFSAGSNGRAFYPFLMKRVPEAVGGNGEVDLETAYGYGGPVFFDLNTEQIDEFYRQMRSWATANHVVAEFIRFNPLTPFQTCVDPACQVSHNRITVSIDLTNGPEAVLNSCSAARQRNWKKGTRLGLSVRRLADPAEFVPLYTQTMQRLAARSYYRFPQQYFAALAALSEDSCFYAGAFTDDGRLAAAAIYLLDPTSAHYHLGASDPQLLHTQANSFLMLEFARRLCGSGRQLLHLGGGLSLADDDSLFRFKSGFSARRHDFFIGRRIFNQQKYALFSGHWQKLTGLTPQILLHYHYGANDENL